MYSSSMPLDVRLYLATDPVLLGSRDLVSVIEAAIAGGVTVIQLRDKSATGRELYQNALRLLEITRPLGVPLIINDRVDIMLASDADGVHVGPKDLPVAAVQKLAPTKIIGTSVNSPADLAMAQEEGADYVGIGPVFPTETKPDLRNLLGLAGLAELASKASMPCVGIGGITLENCVQVIRAGADGICTISGLLKVPDITARAREFRHRIDAAR